MAKFGKWIGAGLGAFAGGPIGAIIGFVIGSAFDGPGTKGSRGASDPYRTTGGYQSSDPYQQARGRTRRPTQGGYAASLLVLVAAVMKADGKTLKSELNFVKEFLVKNFGLESANEALVMLRDILQQDIPVDDVSRQIAMNMDYSSRLQLMHLLFGVAQADGEVHDLELKMISKIGINMGIKTPDYESIKSMFIKNVDAAYKILEINPDASDEDVKKAYRKMAMKYHPDKVSYLGDDFQKSAKEKFQKVNEAYEEIKKKRKIA